MDNFSEYANRPFAFVMRYFRQRSAAHAVILLCVVAAVACSVGTQYGVKSLVDALAYGPAHSGAVWLAFIFLLSLIAADNFLWRIASWVASGRTCGTRSACATVSALFCAVTFSDI